MDITIREMISTDWEAVSKIYMQGIKSNMATFEQIIPSYEQWSSTHMESGRFVAENNGNVVGWIAISATSHREVYSGVCEQSIYVDIDARGQGIGQALIKRQIEFADSNNIWTLQAGILEENEGSIQLHEKCGFRKVGYRKMIGMDKFGLWRNLVLMERRSTTIGFQGCDMKNCKMRDKF